MHWYIPLHEYHFCHQVYSLVECRVANMPRSAHCFYLPRAEWAHQYWPSQNHSIASQKRIHSETKYWFYHSWYIWKLCRTYMVHMWHKEDLLPYMLPLLLCRYLLFRQVWDRFQYLLGKLLKRNNGTVVGGIITNGENFMILENLFEIFGFSTEGKDWTLIENRRIHYLMRKEH